MSLFISDAIAAASSSVAAPGGQPESSFFSLMMIAAIFVLFYFMLIRPQNKRAKEHRELISKIKKGDEIITSSGILAKVNSLDEQYIKVTIAEGVEVIIQRQAISAVLPKGSLKSI
ncbi:MAG: preprotein translocase subunit YajC [Legionella sp.]